MEHNAKIKINHENFRILYDCYYEQLCKYLNYYTKDVHTIEDVVQEIFLKLWETRDQLEISHVKTYLFHTAKHIILNHLRDKDKHSSLLGEWAERQQENIRKQADESERERRLSTLQKAIDTLPAKCKELFILNKQENLTYKQIAELKQISIKTVENQMTIAFKKIRTLMDVSWK